MRKILDFHIHSKYSRATSKHFDLEEMYKWSKIKGVDIISAADFTHPAWFKILEQNQVEYQPGAGLYYLKNKPRDVLFIISTDFLRSEISNPISVSFVSILLFNINESSLS